VRPVTSPTCSRGRASAPAVTVARTSRNSPSRACRASDRATCSNRPGPHREPLAHREPFARRELWKSEEGIFGTYLSYSQGRDVLVEAGRVARDTIKDEPMEFVTFDDGTGLIETVIFPDVYRKVVALLFGSGPYVMRGRVEESYGAITLTVTALDRLDRYARRRGLPWRPVAAQPTV